MSQCYTFELFFQIMGYWGKMDLGDFCVQTIYVPEETLIRKSLQISFSKLCKGLFSMVFEMTLALL